ncbi:MAG: DUF2442 domain-containing protein [Gracilimonas sp.]
MAKLIEIKPMDHGTIWLRYSDQTEGIADLSDIIGKGVFKVLENREKFDAAHISENGGALAWGEDLELCADALYLKISGKKVDEIMPKARNLAMNA